MNSIEQIDLEDGRRELIRLQRQYYDRRDYYRTRAAEYSAQGNAISSHKARELEALVDEFLYYLKQLESMIGMPEDSAP